jgi:hypothetical protein
MTPEMKHDLMMLVIWPAVTALLNLAIKFAGKSEHPLGKLLAAVGTSLTKDSKKDAEKSP